MRKVDKDIVFLIIQVLFDLSDPNSYFSDNNTNIFQLNKFNVILSMVAQLKKRDTIIEGLNSKNFKILVFVMIKIEWRQIVDLVVKIFYYSLTKYFFLQNSTYNRLRFILFPKRVENHSTLKYNL